MNIWNWSKTLEYKAFYRTLQEPNVVVNTIKTSWEMLKKPYHFLFSFWCHNFWQKLDAFRLTSVSFYRKLSKFYTDMTDYQFIWENKLACLPHITCSVLRPALAPIWPLKIILVVVLNPGLRGRIFSRVWPFYARAVSNLDRSMHISLWV